MATPVPQKDDVEQWTVEQVAAWLQQGELSDCCDTFLRRGIDGHRFLQLSEEDLLLWGRDMSIRNRLQIVKLVSQIKSLQQYPSSTRSSIEVSRSVGPQPLKAYNDNAVDCAAKDFSSDEEDTKECAGHEASSPPPIPPRYHGQSPNTATSSSFPRPSIGQNNVLHGPGSRSLETQDDSSWDNYEDSSYNGEETEEYPGQEMQAVKENAHDEERIEDLYLVPLEASSTASHLSMLTRELPTHVQRSNQLPSHPNNSSIIHHHGGATRNQNPVKKERFSFGFDAESNGRSRPPSIPERIPVRGPPPLPPDSLAAHKQLPASHFQASASNIAMHPSLQGVNSHGLAENGSSGVKGGSSLHPFLSNTLPRRLTDKESSQAHLPTQSLEKNDHVYEIVDIPQGSYGGAETLGPNMSDQQSPIRPPIPPPRNQNQDFDDRDLSSRLGPVSLSQGKRPQPPRNQPGPPTLDIISQTDRSRPPKLLPSFSSNSSHSSHKTYPQDIHAPKELAAMPPYPQDIHAPKELAPMPPEGITKSVSLGNGESIELTPLYQKIMDKPYFQFVSRPKAKELVLQGGEGTFLIRPSTRTDNPLTLTVKHDDRSYNINIRQRPDYLFALGNEKAPERTFSSVDEIVSIHYKEPITLTNGECALLKYSPLKPQNNIFKNTTPGFQKRHYNAKC